MTRRFIRKTHPTIKELVEEEQCGCGNRMLPYLMKTAVDPCQDPYLTGTVFSDGFESQPTIAESYAAAATEHEGWCEESASNDTDWVISSANPRSGTYHARGTTTNEIITDALVIVADSSPACPPYDGFWLTSQQSGTYSGIATAGSLVSVTWWVDLQTTGIDRTEITTGYTFMDSNGDFIDNTDQVLTHGLAGYQEFTFQFVAPANSKFFTAYMFSEHRFDLNAITDVDDVSLTIT